MSIEKEQFYKEFINRENDFVRAPYNPEIEFYTTIQAGDVKRVRELCKDSLRDKPGLGRLSDDPLQNLKYHFVITTALVARYCISGGMELSAAYSLSDYYIHRADRCRHAQEISALHPIMCEDYAKRMRNLRRNTICSKPVAQCIHYIYDHLHAKITVSILAEHVGLNSNYLSRLFKKEVGSTISQYVRAQKLETAKNMLLYSDYTPAQIATTLAFPSQSYFTEVFHRATGLTPGEFRKQNYHV